MVVQSTSGCGEEVFLKKWCLLGPICMPILTVAMKVSHESNNFSQNKFSAPLRDPVTIEWVVVQFLCHAQGIT